MAFLEDRRFVFELDDGESSSEGWDKRQVVLSLMEEGRGFYADVVDFRTRSPLFLPESRTVCRESYWLCDHVSNNVPGHLDRRRLANVMGLIPHAHGRAAADALWSLFYEVVLMAAADDDGHWLHSVAPKCAGFYRQHLHSLRERRVAEVMDS